MDLVALESEVFLLGRWLNYEELEDSLSMEELVVTVNALREKEDRERKFLAALQGVDIEENKDDSNDIADLKGFQASEAGFGIGLGLGYMEVNEIPE